MQTRNTKNVQRRRAIKATLIVTAIIMLIPVASFAQEEVQNTSRIASIASTVVDQSFDACADNVSASNTSEAVNDSALNSETNFDVDISKLASIMGVQTSDAAPEAFTNECFDVSGESNLLVEKQGSLLSFTTGEGAEDAFNNITQKLEDNGWTSAKTNAGTDDGAQSNTQSGSQSDESSDTQLDSQPGMQCTFVKDSGDIRWLYLTCLNIGGETCVVIQTS